MELDRRQARLNLVRWLGERRAERAADAATMSGPVRMEVRWLEKYQNESETKSELVDLLCARPSSVGRLFDGPSFGARVWHVRVLRAKTGSHPASCSLLSRGSSAGQAFRVQKLIVK